MLPATSPPAEPTASEILGANLRRLRVEAGLTQKHVAADIGVSRAHYVALENGSSSNGAPANPRLSTLLALRHVLSAELAAILDGVV